MRSVVERCPQPLYPPDDDDDVDEVLFLWVDPKGVLLEIVGIELANGDVLAIHAMKMRRKYQADFAKVTAGE